MCSVSASSRWLKTSRLLTAGPSWDAEGQMVRSQQVITASHPEDAAEVPAPASVQHSCDKAIHVLQRNPHSQIHLKPPQRGSLWKLLGDLKMKWEPTIPLNISSIYLGDFTIQLFHNIEMGMKTAFVIQCANLTFNFYLPLPTLNRRFHSSIFVYLYVPLCLFRMFCLVATQINLPCLSKS